MKILLDTHVLLWALSNDAKLPDKARKIIENEDNEIYCSVASLWEVELKHMLHPRAMTISAKQLAEYCDQAGVQRILIREKHIFALPDLKRDKNAAPHKDPFDRILICQAMTEDMMLVTHDALISDYNEPCVLKV